MTNLQDIRILRGQYNWLVAVGNAVFEMDAVMLPNGIDIYLGELDSIYLEDYEPEPDPPVEIYKKIIQRLCNELNHFEAEAKALLEKGEEDEHTDVGEVNDFLLEVAGLLNV